MTKSVIAGVILSLIGAVCLALISQNTTNVLQETPVDAGNVYTFEFLSQDDDMESDSDEVYYSDGFFVDSDGGYDHQLAKASLALSMTAFKERFVNEFLTDLGYWNVAAYRYDQQIDEDKAAMMMGHKTADGKTIVAAVVRGGKYGDEWGSNGRVGYEGETFGYHYGFHKAAEDAVVQLKEYAADNDIHLEDAKIWITGFSRGAAVANVMGAMLTGTDAVSSNDAGGTGSAVIISPENLFDYTFASPNTVSAQLITEIPVKGIYNIVNPLDIVTRLPMNAGGISQTSKGKTVRYNWDYVKYGTDVEFPADSESAQLQLVQLLENALAFATRDEQRYVEKTQDQVVVPALKRTLGKGADVSNRNIGVVLVDSLPGVATFIKNEIDQLDLQARIYAAGLISGKRSVRLEKEHWPETYWRWMVKTDEL